MVSVITAPKQVSLAIFPFENLSAHGQTALLCKAFTTEISTELARFRQLQVIGQYSMTQLQAQQTPLPVSLHTLKPDFHLSGTFRGNAKTFILHVQLFNSHSLQVVWGGKFEGQTEDFFETSEELIGQMVATLSEQLQYQLLANAPLKPLADWSAYEAFLYGMEALKLGSTQNDLTAREYFQLAIDKSPEYSYAYSGMSLSYFNEWSCQLWERWEVSKNGAYEWAAKAISIDEYNYMASYVLGRVFLYEGLYETSEYYLRKSLALNPNDPDYLVQVATCLVYHNYPDEAWELYKKAVKLNPLKKELYLHNGLFIRMEQGRWEEALAIARQKPHAKWVDFEAMLAGIQYHLGNHKAMYLHWERFMEQYREAVQGKLPDTPAHAVYWLNQINPYRCQTVLAPFWSFISGQAFTGIAPETQAVTVVSSAQHTPRLSLYDDWCEMVWEHQTYRFRQAKGFHDLAKLLAQPYEPVHCAELMAVKLVSGGDTWLMDEKAKKTYKNQLLELQESIAAAENNGQYAELESLQLAYDQLIDHLSGSLGLAGKIRRANTPLDKARSAVTWRIRSAISKVEKAAPSLGKHLTNSIKTGTICSYSPEKDPHWQIMP